MALLPQPTPNIVVVMVGNELRKNRIMNGSTTIVTDVSHAVHNRIQMSTTQRKQLGCWRSYARRIKGLVLSNDSKSRGLCWSSRRTEIHPKTVASSDPHMALTPSLESKNSSTILQPAR